MIRKYLYILLLFFLQQTFAQYDVIQTLDAHNGLSQNDVKCICQDHQGFLWFGTNDGLNRFDGYEFTSYRFDPEHGKGLNSNLITCIVEDAYHNMWVGTADRGVNLIRFSDDKIVNVVIPGDTSNLLEKENINAIKVVNHHVLILAKEYMYVLTYDADGYTPLVTEEGYGYKTKTFANYILQALDSNNFLLGTSNSIKHLHLSFSDTLKIKQRVLRKWVNVTDMQPFRNGYLVSCSGRTFFLNKKLKMRQISSAQYNCFFVLNDSVVWAGNNEGLHQIIFSKKYLRNHRIVKSFTVENTHGQLQSNIIRTIYKDNLGILWLGTEGGGVSKVLNRSNKFTNIHNTLFGKNTPNGINCFYEDSEQKLWVGMDKDGLVIYPKGTVDYNSGMKHIHPGASGIYNVLCIYELNINGTPNIIVGSHYPIYHKVYNIKGEEIKGSKLSEMLRHIDHPICDMAADDTNLWITTYEGGGYRYNYRQGTVSMFRTRNNKSLKTNLLNSVVFDAQKRLWLGSDKGLYMLTPKQQYSDYPFFKCLQQVKGDSSSISNDYVVPILETANHQIWVGTFGGGLNLLNDSNWTFERVTSADGLSNNTIKGLMEDEQQRLWISSNQGLSCLDPLHKQMLNFGTSDGLQDLEFQTMACGRKQNGELLFGGKKGFNTFFPSHISVDSTPPNIVFTELQIKSPSGNEDVVINRSRLEHYSAEKTSLELHHNENSFTAFFSAIHFIAPRKIMYKYRLQGFEEHWNHTDANSRFAKYTNLNPGRYTLEILATNSDGIWAKQALKLNIKIKLPWYQTPYAYLAYFVLLVALVVFFNRYSIIQNNIKQTLLMERFEKEKEKELTQVKLRFFTNISHELRTPLSVIKSYFDEMAPKWDTLPKEKVNKDFSIIGKNVDNLLRLVSQILDFRKLENEKLVLNPQCGNLVAFIDAKIEAFRMVAARKNISLNYSHKNPIAKLWFDEEKMEKIIHNLLSNAIKYTSDGGLVNVVLTDTTDEFIVRVEDNGIGIAKEEQSKVFDRFYRVPNSTLHDLNSSGIGLSLTKGLVELHHGKIELVSTVGKGSSFVLYFPKGNELVQNKIEQVGYPDQTKTGSSVPQAPTLQEATQNLYQDRLVLLVEDNTDLRDFMENKLLQHFKVKTAENGKIGVARCKELTPDLVISDVMMPEMNGYDLCEAVKNDEHTSHIPIILLTAKTADESKLLGYTLGADAYVSKPFNFDVLLAQSMAILKSREKIWKKIAENPFFKTAEVTFNNHDEEFLNKVTGLIEAHMADPKFRVDVLAGLYHISQDQLNKKIKAITGKTCVQFIRMVRLKKAAQLLQNPSSRVSDVTYEVGYVDLQHFRQHFKKEFNQSPADYKKTFAQG